MALPQVKINVIGAITRPFANIDGISGMPFWNDNIADLTTFSGTNRIIKFTNLGTVEATGITSDSTNFQNEWYQIKEHFRKNGGDLYIGIFDVPATTYDFAELTLMQNFADNNINLFGIFNPQLALASTEFSKINVILSTFDTEKRPAYAVYGANIDTLTLATLVDLRNLAADLEFVSVVIGQDTKNEPLLLTDSTPNVGVVLGALSSSNVAVNIMNPNDFNYTDGVAMVEPGFYDSTGFIASKDVAQADLDTLNDSGYIFWRHFPNLSGTYLSNDNNCVKVSETFNSIHIVRTRNKSVRQIDAVLTPLLGSKLYFTAAGLLTSATTGLYEATASGPLQNMVNNGEISAFDVYVNPDQNSLVTKTVTVEIQIVPVESGDNIIVNLTYTNLIV